MPDRPKRHHTVPKFHLRGFAARTRLEAVNVHTGVRHSTNISDATAESNFYTVQEYLPDPTYFESALSEVEASAAALYREIVGGTWPLEPPDRVAFAEFMTLQFLRVQSHRTQMHNVIAAELHALAEAEPDEFRRILALPGVPAGIDLDSGNLPSLISSAVHVRQINLLLPQLVGHLLRRPWEIVRFEHPSLLTSDEPLTPLPNPDEHQDVGLGLDNSWVLVFPLTRKIAILMFRDPMRSISDRTSETIVQGGFDFSRFGDGESSRLFNMNTVMHAHRFVFHHPDDRHLLPDNVTELSKRGGRINFNDIPDGLLPSA